MLRSVDSVQLSTPRRHPDTDIAAAATSRRRDPRPRRAPRRERADQTGCGRRWLVEECENAECRRNIRHQTPCVGRHHHQVQVQVVELLLGAGWWAETGWAAQHIISIYFDNGRNYQHFNKHHNIVYVWRPRPRLCGIDDICVTAKSGDGHWSEEARGLWSPLLSSRTSGEI